MTSEREAMFKALDFQLVINSYQGDIAQPSNYFCAGWKAAMEHQAARQDWPSEDEAVEVMINSLPIPNWDYEITMREAYRALLAATPDRQDWRPIPDGWHVSWMGKSGHDYLCQISFHYGSENPDAITFVSRTGLTLQEAYKNAVAALPPAPKGGDNS